MEVVSSHYRELDASRCFIVGAVSLEAVDQMLYPYDLIFVDPWQFTTIHSCNDNVVPQICAHNPAEYRLARGQKAV